MMNIYTEKKITIMTLFFCVFTTFIHYAYIYLWGLLKNIVYAFNNKKLLKQQEKSADIIPCMYEWFG